jgi:hypothetical protein
VFNKEVPEMFESVSKDLLLCELCGDIIAAADHINWVRDRLGAKAYAHPNMLLGIQREFSDVEPCYPKERIRREDQIMEVCPKCRNKVVTEDEYNGYK